MAANSDFFVKFSSNATDFASQLERDLKPARAVLAQFQSALAGLEKRSSQSGSRIRQELAKGGAAPGASGTTPGVGAQLAPINVSAMQEAVRLQAVATNEVIEDLRQVAGALELAKRAISGLPQAVANAKRGLASQDLRNAEIAAGVGRDRNTTTGVFTRTGTGVAGGSPEDIISRALRRLDTQTGGTFGRPSGVPQLPAASIASVRRSDIDRANFDRIVAAIDRQTAALRGTGKGGGGGGAAAKVSQSGQAVVEAVEELGEDVAEEGNEAAKKLALIDKLLSQAIAKMGDGADDATRTMIEGLQRQRNALAAEARRVERETTGISQAEQKKRAQAEYASRESITDVERDRRLAQQALINSPGSSDFDSRLGTARTAAGGNYSKADLAQMVQAFRALGIRVDANTKSTKEQTAAALKAAAAQYERDYPEGHPDLQTSGFNVTKTTQISQALSDLVGPLEGAAYEIQQAREKIRADRVSGGTGDKPTSREDALPGTIGATKDFAGNWRGSFGAAVGDAPGLFTAQQIMEAEKVVAADAKRQMENARRRIGQADFDPYAISGRKEIQTGQSDADRALAEAASSALRDLRLATHELDEFGRKAVQRSHDLRAAQAENQAFIDRARARIDEGREQPDDRARLLQAESQIAPKLARQQAALEPFLTAEYQAGLAKRDASRAALEAAREESRNRRHTIASYRDMQQSLGQAVLGVTTAAGSRSIRRDIPGLGFAAAEKGGQPRFVDLNEGGPGAVNPAEMEKINQAARKTAAAQFKYQRTLADADATEEDKTKATERLEHAADTLARRIARNFNGIAPELQGLTGRAPTNPDVIAAEADRQLARDHAAAEARRKFVQTPEELGRQREVAVVRTQAQLAKVTEERAELARTMAAQEAKISRALGGNATTIQHTMGRWTKLSDTIDKTERQLEQLRARRAIWQDPARTPGAIQTEGHAAGPLMDTLGYEKNLGYGPGFNDEIERLAQQRADLEAQRRREFGGTGGTIGNLRETAREADLLDRQIEKLERELREATAATQKKAATARTEADATTRTTAAANGRIAELLRERDALRAAGQYTKQQREAAKTAGDTALVSEIDTRRRELARVKAELRSLGGTGGGGTTPPGTRTGGGGTGGDDRSRSLLAQILSTLKGIHATLRGGIKTSAIRPTATSTTGGATTTRTTPGSAVGATPQQVRDAQALARAQKVQAANEQRARGEARKSERDAKAVARAEAEKAAAVDKADRELREQARAAELVNNIGRQLSETTQKEVVELARLTAAAQKAATAEQKLAAQKAIAAQQSKVAAGINRDLANSTYADRRKATSTILNAAGPSVGGGEVDNILRTMPIEQARTAGRSIGTDMGGEALDGFARVFGGNTSFWSRIMHTTGTFVVRNFAAGFVFGLTNAMQEVLTQALAAEATFVRVADALSATNKEVGDLRSGLSQMSSDYGVALNDTYTTAASLTGLFDNVQDLEAATRISTQLQTISNGALNADEAVGVLASTMSGFGLEGVEGAEHIADVLTSIQNNLGVNVETSAEGIARMAGLAAQMKISFEETGVFVSAIAKQTNQTGAAAGEQFSRILAAMQGSKGRSALQEAFGDSGIAPQIPELVANGEYGSALTEIMRNWDNLSDVQQRNLGVSLAGQRQMASWNALMNDSERNLRALDKAQNSQGEASERMEKILKNLQSRIAQLSTTFQVLFDQLLQTGILNIVGVALIGITEALQVINTVLGNINEFADSNPLLSFLRDAAGFALGAVIAFKLLGVAVRGIRGAMLEEGLLGGGRRTPAAPTGPRPPATVISRGGVPVDQPSALRNGVLAAGATRLVTPGLNQMRVGIDGANRVIGRWTSGFTPNGRFSKPIAEFGRNLADRSARNLGALEAARTQTRPPSLFDNPQGALDYADQNGGANQNALNSQARRYEQSSRVAQKATAGTSRALGVFGRAAVVGATATNRLATAVRGLGLAGFGADIALVAVTLGLARLMENAQRSGRLAEAAADSYERLYGPDSKAGSEGGEDKPAYVGPAREALDAELEQLRIDSQGAMGDVMDTLGIFTRTFNDIFLSNPLDGIDVRGIEEYSDERFGIDSGTGLPAGRQETTELQNKLISEGSDLFSAKSAEQLQEVADFYDRELESIAAEAKSAFEQGDISGMQYASVLAEVESADAWIRGEIADRQAVMEGLAAGTALSADQVNKLLDTMSLIQTIGSSPILSTISDGGLDIGAILEEQIDRIGLADDSKLRARLQKLLGPAASPDADILKQYGPESMSTDMLAQYAPPSAVDLSRASVAVSKEAFKQAARELDSLQASNADETDIADAQAAKDRALGEYLNSLNGLVDTIYSDSDMAAELQTASGNMEGAMQTRVRAIQQVDRIFARQNSYLIAPLRAARRAAARLQNQTDRLRAELIKAGQDPNQNQEYLDLTAVLGSTRNDVQRLRRLLQGTAQWRQHAGRQIAKVHAAIQAAIVTATADLNLQIARATTDELRAQLEAQKAAIINNMLSQFNKGMVPDGVEIPKGIVKRWGNMAVNEEELNQSRVDNINAQQSYDDAQAQAAEDAQAAQDEAKANAAERRQNAAALKQARLGVAAAAAEARGDSVAAARVQVAMAKAMIAAARADLAAATTQSESAQARIAILNAQAQLIGAVAAVQSAQADLVQSQYDVSIALAEAAGHTVLAASRTLAAARAALGAALKRSKGKATAEVNAARAEAIRAEAALRDAKLQDSLDTIDFNLEMGRITQSSAIAALKEILRTRDLTRDQRRQLLLQIKGMKEEMADSQWNIGDIKLPTPYQMRRYIEERRQQFRNELNQAAGGNAPTTGGPPRESTTTHHTEQTNHFHINGADTAKVKKIVTEIVGGGQSTHRTTGARRGGR